MAEDYKRGRGAQINTANPFLEKQYVTEHLEGLDEELTEVSPQTEVFYESAKKVVNKVDSPDLGIMWSINPYQGCEHGCVYCYARNSHTYWGFSAGLDFETKIIAKTDAPKLLEKHFLNPRWKPSPIMLSGNTDCYQPLEKKLEITRGLLKVFLRFGNPVGLISKNVLVRRDVDVLKELAAENLVHVFFSITTLNEKLRQVMEPRTATITKKLETIEALSSAGVPVGVMTAPVIPGLNDHELPSILKAVADHGALTAAYTVVRLNGSIDKIFENWLRTNFPDRYRKIWNQISHLHGGTVNDSKWYRRMKGEGNYSEHISQLFKASRKKHFEGREMPQLDVTRFRRKGNLRLF